MSRNGEVQQLRKTSHISYKDYKKKVSRKSNSGMVVFVSAFFMMLLIFLGIAKQISPDVDVSIGDGEMTKEEMVKASVDDRLKLIHMEDNAYQNDDTFSPELEEKVRLPKFVQKDGEMVKPTQESPWADLSDANKSKELDKKKVIKDIESKFSSDFQETINENMKQHQDIINSMKKMPLQSPVTSNSSGVNNGTNMNTSAPTVSKPQVAVRTVAPAPTAAPTPSAVAAKVIVGHYASMEQAQVAKEIISEAGLNIDPFIKNIGGAYTIQIGSFSTKEKAQTAANELLKHNFPARVIVEQ